MALAVETSASNGFQVMYDEESLQTSPCNALGPEAPGCEPPRQQAPPGGSGAAASSAARAPGDGREPSLPLADDGSLRPPAGEAGSSASSEDLQPAPLDFRIVIPPEDVRLEESDDDGSGPAEVGHRQFTFNPVRRPGGPGSGDGGPLGGLGSPPAPPSESRSTTPSTVRYPLSNQELSSLSTVDGLRTPPLGGGPPLSLEDARNAVPNEQLQPTVSPRTIGAPSASRQSQTKKLQEEFDERRELLKAQADLRVADMTADASLLNIPAEGALRVQQKKEEAWKIMQKAMGVDEAGLSKDSWETGMMGVVNLSYLMVIVGCELDLYGFMMAFHSYWGMGRIEVQMLLIACPLGYLLATAMYMVYNRTVVQRMAEESKLDDQKKGQKGAPPRGAQARDGPERPLSRLTAREPIKVEYYHFLPIFRYYLVIKDKEAADVEGLFRVNSLSSFSLGIAQICGILFQMFVVGDELSVFVRINIGSQFLNWFITLMYFTTPVAARMKSAIKVDALVYNSNQEMRRLYENYMQLTADYARSESEDDRAKLQHVEASIDREIAEFCKAKLDLTQFDMKTKFNALRLIRRKQYNIYARI